MRFKRPAISNLRLTRFHRWALLWLTWFAAFLDEAAAFAPNLVTHTNPTNGVQSSACRAIGVCHQVHAIAHQWLDKIERIIVAIAVIHLARRIRRRPQRKRLYADHPNQRISMRAVLGSRLRRALRPKDLHARIEALRQSIDTLIARLLKRLPCGLTRPAIIARLELHSTGRAIDHVGAMLSADTS